ncbi:hypothetical protein ACEQ8H_005700 [Pleosporales sp. CAS-2024a]
MAKRPADSSPEFEQPRAKKLKTADPETTPVTTTVSPKVARAPDSILARQISPADPIDSGESDEDAESGAAGIDLPDATWDLETDPLVAAAAKTDKKEPKPKTAKYKKDVNKKSESKAKTASKCNREAEAKVSKRRGNPKAATVHEGFDAWKPDPAALSKPDNNGWWGLKPVSGDARPDAEQPSARKSNGATNPPMFEDRGFRFKRGSRYVKYFGPVKPEGADDGPDLDQEDLLVIRVIDMRTTTKGRKPTAQDVAVEPKRTTNVYFCDHGKPKDWNSMQTIKALNDRRSQAIDRITQDAPWTKMEREYLGQLLAETPDASIWDLTERHNDRFMNKDCVLAVGWELSPGRTVESVRHEYVTYKPLYDRGDVPVTRWSRDKTAQGERTTRKMNTVFGTPRLIRQLQNGRAADSDSDDHDDHDDAHAHVHVDTESDRMVEPAKQIAKPPNLPTDAPDEEHSAFVQGLNNDAEQILSFPTKHGSPR